MKRIIYLFGLMIMVYVIGCSPKPVEETTETEPIEAVNEPDEDLSPCPKFKDNANADDLESTYVVYRDFVKLNKLDRESFNMWKRVYENAPAADGKRWTVYSDGIKFYEHFLRTETDSTKIKDYVKRILNLYDEIGECYPEQKTYVKARKAFDLYYKFQKEATNQQIYDIFREVIDEKGGETYVFVLNPFTKLMVDGFLNGEIDTMAARKYAQSVPEIINQGLTKGENLKSWVTVRDYAIPYIERLEAVKGFYDCMYFKDKYMPLFDSADKTCEEATLYYSKMRFGGCSKEDPDLKTMYQWLGENDCLETPASDDPCRSALSQAYESLREGAYQSAVQFFEQAIDCSTVDQNKATYNLLIAKIYYAHLKNYGLSRSYALKAAQLRGGWGEPYILVGKLYASSGPLCGPGRGFDSQVVTWPAIDKWNYAKSIDRSVANEANKLIGQYKQYMPSIEDVFSRSLQVGDRFKVECWIQETTTIRTAK